MENRVTLKGVNVLVDGYNLELRQGTGISSYGITVIRGLKRLGAEVGVLCSNRVSRNPKLAEVLLFDRLRDRAPAPGLLGLLSVAKAMPGLLRRPARVEIGDAVSKVAVGTFFDEIAPQVSLYAVGDCYRIANNLHKLLGVTTRIDNPGRVAIWHATCPLPMRVKGARKITTIHDVIPLKLPHLTLEDKRGFYGVVRACLKDSDLVLCDSENTRTDVLSFFDVRPEKLRVIYLPIALDARAADDEARVAACLRKHDLVRRRFLLYVGALEPRKNVGGLAEAYAAIDTDMPLVLVGKKTALWDAEIKRLEAVRNVKVLEYVSPRDLACLYAAAYVLVFPSYYEGYGLPPLEAMSFGCPVITSAVSSLPELYADAALYVNPADVADIRAKLRQMIEDQALRDRYAAAGRERAKAFSMERYVEQLKSAYQSVL